MAFILLAICGLVAADAACGSNSISCPGVGCCNAVYPAGCYRPITTRSTTTITGAWGCYPTPPGIIVGATTETDTLRSTQSIQTTSVRTSSIQTTATARSSQTLQSPSALSTSPVSGCRSDQKSCGAGCISTSASCCPDGGYCGAGYFCKETKGRWGCCGSGDLCDTANCPSGYKACVNYCILASNSCCPDGGYCNSGYTCYVRSDGSEGCCQSGKNCPGDTTSRSLGSSKTSSHSSYLVSESVTDFEMPTITPFSIGSNTQVTTSPTVAVQTGRIGEGSVKESWFWKVFGLFILPVLL